LTRKLTKYPELRELTIAEEPARTRVKRSRQIIWTYRPA
jgi:hypothetical protein